MGVNTIVQPPPTERQLGPKVSKADTATLQGIFAGSPIYSGDITDAERHAEASRALSSRIISPDFPAGFDPNFTGAPDVTTVDTGGAGLPATPYLPNPTSPGEGSTNATDQAEAPESFPGSNATAPANPSVTSARIAGGTLGDYIKGRAPSPAG